MNSLFCPEIESEVIDLLKGETEGGDLRKYEGFLFVLGREAIRFVYF